MSEAEAATEPKVVKVKPPKRTGGHHGGSWKVALADFMTAMFALFLVLWLIGTIDDEGRADMAEYFRDPSSSVIERDSAGSDDLIDQDHTAEHEPDLTEIEREMQRLQEQQMEMLWDAVNEAIGDDPSLDNLEDQVLIDTVPDGLRIQIVDDEDRPMFPLGNADLEDYANTLLDQIADVVDDVPNAVTITGHTDAVPFQPGVDGDNWELSTQRAHAARRAMEDGGIDPDQIAQVTGYADTVLFDSENPDNPMNRRISIVVLNPDAEQAIGYGPENEVSEQQPLGD